MAEAGDLADSVIGAATIRAGVDGVDVLGIEDGFEWIMQGDIKHVRPLNIENVSRIHFRGGSHIGISRANPTKSDQLLENAVVSLLRLGVTDLITIGGDDTAYSARRVSEEAAGRIRVAHVPKTMHNDLPLPGGVPTFGFETAREQATRIVSNLMEDARTSGRWFFVVMVGRSAGHLALGAAKAACVHHLLP